ncbi:MAG: cysteine desulfurase NifS [Clostridiales bacterium]|nr:cysteine desulfurase NifS [Clostridiales bacterium]
MKQKVIYLDNAATTRMRQEVLDAMLPYFIENYGNASSVYSVGRKSKAVLDEARTSVAKSLGAKDREIFFTGGGSESDNWAIKGVAFANRSKGNHIITTKIEHHAVLHTCQYLEKQGFEVTYLPVDKDGLVSLKDLEDAIRPTTILITVMFANNEIGTIEPIKEIGAIAKKHNIYFHTDAVQAVGHVPINVSELNIDLMSFSSHKFCGPKGVGGLYIKSGVKIDSLIHGGAQERGKRASTENIAGVIGMAKALELAVTEMEQENKRILTLREELINQIFEKIPHVRLNGSREKRLPSNVNFSIQYIEGESLLLMLDMMGICASSGSACTSGSLDPSHVLLAIGLPHEIAHGSLRLSLGRETTKEDVEEVLRVLPGIVERLRDMSPLYDKEK